MQITNIIVLCALLPALGLGAPAGGVAGKIKAALGGAKAAAGGAAAGGAASGGASAGSNASNNGTASTGNASAGNASNNGTTSAGNASNGNASNGNASSSSATASTTAAPNANNGGNNASNGNGGQNAAQSSVSSAYANAASAQAVINPKFNGGNPPIDVTIAKESVGAAVNGWQADTGMVSNWLNTATSLSGDAFTQGATLAYNAEVNELNHKAVLDKNLPQQSIAAANDTLAAQGSFQAVVDSLQAMISEGPATAQARVAEINNNRCVNVLPNINAYFAAAGSSASTASVPTGCAAVAVTNSISVIPTEAPGSIGGNGTPPQNNQAGAQTTNAPNANNNNNGGNAQQGGQQGGNNAQQGGNNANQGANNAQGNNAQGNNNNGAQSSSTTSSQGGNGANTAQATGGNGN